MKMKINQLRAYGLITVIKILIVTCIPNVASLETPEPASLLRPRDYNPHPYDNGEIDHVNRVEENISDNELKYFQNLYNQAPIQFPKNDVDSGKLSHPYEKLALKERTRKTERFSGNDNQVLPTAFSALARHAKKVLKKKYDFDYYDEHTEPLSDSSNYDKKHYAFSYTVKDKASGDDFSHTQQQVNGAVKGSYKVHLPDGRMQVVSYIADDNGYRADVTYENDYDTHRSEPAPAPIVESQKPVYSHYKTLYETDNHISNTPTPYYHTSPLVKVNIQSYNESPYKKQPLNTNAVASPSPGYSFATTPTPYYHSSPAESLQIHSNHLSNRLSSVVTSPIPDYAEVNVTPRNSHTTDAIYLPQKGHSYDYYNDYHDYVQIQPSSHYTPKIHRRRSTNSKKSTSRSGTKNKK